MLVPKTRDFQTKSIGALFHPNSFCPNCDMNLCTYATHIEHKEHPQQRILGTAVQFCEAFFHIFRSPELQIEDHVNIFNTNHDDCRLQCVSMIVRLGKEFISRYTNCRRTHCEEFMVKDEKLQKTLANTKCKLLTIYLKFDHNKPMLDHRMNLNHFDFLLVV